MRKDIKPLFLAAALLASACPAMGQRIVSENVFKDITTLASVRSQRFAIPSPSGKLRKKGKPVVFYIGDSTMRNGSKGDGSNSGQWGWGLFAQEWFDADELVCENHGMGGTSSRTYYTSQLWQDVKNALQPGDYVVISFGHNDGGSNYAGGKSSISGTSATETKTVTNSNGQTETVYTFGQYLRFYIDETLAKGATPILCSRTPRYGFSNGKCNMESNYRSWGKAIAQEKGVSYIDQEYYVAQRYTTFGEWKTYQYFNADNTLHPGLHGAWECAYGAALAIAADPENPLHPYLLDTTPPTLSIERTEGQPYTFTVGGSTATSARDCYRSGDWSLVYNTLQPGDTVVMRFGSSELTATQSGGELGCLQQTDDKLSNLKMSATGRMEMVGSYGWYIHYFVNDCRERGAVAVLESYEAPQKVKDWNMTLASQYNLELRETTNGVTYVVPAAEQYPFEDWAPADGSGTLTRKPGSTITEHINGEDVELITEDGYITLQNTRHPLNGRLAIQPGLTLSAKSGLVMKGSKNTYFAITGLKAGDRVTLLFKSLQGLHAVSANCALLADDGTLTPLTDEDLQPANCLATQTRHTLVMQQDGDLVLLRPYNVSTTLQLLSIGREPYELNPTAISTHATAAPVADDAVYSLSGMRMRQPAKGLYIRNGKKYVVR